MSNAVRPGNEVLEDRSYGNGNVDLELVEFGGGVRETRGTMARMKETAAQVRQAFSDGGWQCWVPAPAFPREVEFVRVKATGETFRRLDAQALGSSSSGRETWRYTLTDPL